MRVLHLLDGAVLRRTEYRSRTLSLIGALRAQGVQTVQLAGPSPDAGDQAGDGAAPGWHVYRTPAPARPGWWTQAGAVPLQATLSAAALALRLRQLARLTRPDLIHVHTPGGNAPAWHALAALMAAGQRLPLVAEAERRGGARHALPPLERWALTRAAALSASSLEMRAALRGAGVRCSRIAVIPAASDLAGIPRCDPTPAGLEGAPLLAFAGPLARAGGVDLLLAALETVRRRYPALRLVVAGGGLREEDLVARVRASRARGHVVVTGTLSARRSADLLPRADIAVFPALAGSAEPLAPPRQLLDAMAQGCAIVASDIACHRELLVHGHSAMLFPAGSRKALAEALLGLLERPERRRALGVSAEAFAASRHSWAATATGYRSLYRDVLGERRP
jgi:glycogen(starch) synthase